MTTNKDKKPNNNRKQNQDPFQNRDLSQDDMRGEFGSTFDIDQLTEQQNNKKTRNNKDLDPGTRNF